LIRQAGGDDLARLKPDSEAAVRICGLVSSYGTDRPFIRYWCDQGHKAFISLIDDNANLAAENDADFEEIAVFFAMHPEIVNVRTSRIAAGEIAKSGVWQAEYGSVMTTGANTEQPTKKPEPLFPREVYPVLKACFEDMPEFEAWYADVSHRIRHGFCRIVGFRHEGVPVSCAMTTSECKEAAVIGGVATLEGARGRGYASSNVLTLADMLLSEGKRVFLSPKNESARALYSQIGFRECSGWGNLKK
jgi:GNAT superfamily N-acetyltransferase